MKTIIDTMTDDKLFAKTFRRKGFLKKRDTFLAWKSFLSALFALPLDQASMETFRKHTGREIQPTEAFRECFVVAGRRSGKSLVSALVAIFLACFKNYDDVLAPGEIGVVMVVAASRSQAQVIFGYIKAFLQVPLLKAMVVTELKEAITLNNRVALEIHTSSYRSTRGRTLCAAICDEVAFWEASENSANPDIEVLNAVRPGLATTGGLLLCISSPYAKRGVLYNAFRDHYGKSNSPVLIWRGASTELNPTLDQRVVDEALRRDHAAGAAEYLAEFRSDVSSFIDAELVEQAVVRGRTSLPYIERFRYHGFCDMSGGRGDSAALAISHEENKRGVLDLIVERPAPHDPQQVAEEFCSILKAYHLTRVTGDKYAANFTVEAFSRRGIHYQSSEKNRSQIYLEFLPLLTSGAVDLLDHDRMKMQFIGLQRRTGRAADIIDHMPGHSDDISNACAGSLIAAAGSFHFLGVVEWIKKQEQKMERGEISPAAKPPIALPVKKAEPPTDKKCPSCGSVAIIRVAGGQQHCNQCSAQWGPTQRTSIPSRRDRDGSWADKL